MKIYQPLQIIFLTFILIFSVSAQSSSQPKVSLNVTVTDAQGRFVDGLTADNFKLYDNGKEQRLNSIKIDDSPLSIGFLVDVSASMSKNFDSSVKFNRIDWGRQSILDFLAESDKRNDYFLSTFGVKTKLFSNFQSANEIEKIIRDNSYFVAPKEPETGFYDSVALAIEYISKSKNQRKMLFILSDAQDNKSLRDFDELHNLAKENKVTIFLMAIYDSTAPYIGTKLHSDAESKVNKLTKDSGGQAYYVINLNQARAMATLIARAVKTQYKLTFASTTDVKENKWRTLQIKMNLSEDKKKSVKQPFITYRKGYFTVSEFLTAN